MGVCGCCSQTKSTVQPRDLLGELCDECWEERDDCPHCQLALAGAPADEPDHEPQASPLPVIHSPRRGHRLVEVAAICLFFVGIAATVFLFRHSSTGDPRSVDEKRLELSDRLTLAGIYPADPELFVQVVEDACTMTEDEMGWYAAGLVDQGTGLAAADVGYRAWCPDRLTDWRTATAHIPRH